LETALDHLPPEVPSPPKPSRWSTLAWLAWLAPLGVLLWFFWHYPLLWRKDAETSYQLFFSLGNLSKLCAGFYAFFILPGWLYLWIRERGPSRVSWADASRVMLALLLGLSAQTIALFLQKYLHLPYRPLPVGLCLAAGYLVAFGLAQFLPWGQVLERAASAPSMRNAEQWVSDLLLLVAVILGWEMTLRGRASSISLMGDGYPHLIYFLGTLTHGPMPDGNVFYSSFVLNITPMGFHTIWASLKTMIPGLLHLDFIRYFSFAMVPIFIACLMALFTQLAGNRLAAAILTLAASFISGGGLSLSVPIVFFPWYWSLGWCLAAAVFWLLLKNKFESAWVSGFAGWIMGIGFLMHAFFAVRMTVIVGLFFVFELLRRLWLREAPFAFLKNAALFIFGAAIPFGSWMLPMVLQHGWEATYSYDYLVQNYSAVAPEGIRYIRNFKEVHYRLADLWYWSRGNAGLLPVFLAPVGIAICLLRRREARSYLLLAWLIAMASAILMRYVPNPYRYFEFFFFGLAACAALALGAMFRKTPEPWKTYLMAATTVVLGVSMMVDFSPKYRKAIVTYGRTQAKPSDEVRQENRATSYLRSQRAGNLDRDFGGFTGHLWLRQKKVWDIYLKHLEK